MTVFPDWATSDSLLTEMLARDAALGPNHLVLDVDQVDRRILLKKLADAYRELDEALERVDHLELILRERQQ